jgi:glyoxylase-like metal-dependent hydrolase (beta-lactamase superfamily II)
MPDLAAFDIALVRAGNPSALTLTGTNTWIAGHHPAWVIDPGPALDAHVEAVAAAVEARGGAGGIALTHDHIDHVEAVGWLVERLGGDVRVAAARGDVDVVLADGDTFGPLAVAALPGHADDHLVFGFGDAAFVGDTVLGEGSVFVQSRLREYMAGLARLRERRLGLLCPGHGEPVFDPDARLGELIAHREAREAALVAALDRGLRTDDELLDAAWPDAPPQLRGPAALSLAAHLEKLREEGRLP